MKAWNKFYQSTYRRKNNYPFLFFLLLIGFQYPVLSGDLTLHFGTTVTIVYTIVLSVLLLLHVILTMKNWYTIIYGWNE